MELTDLEVLVEAVRQGSLSAAGRRLGLTPVAASRRLAALEGELGVRLVHRTTRSLSLTPEGETFLPHAETILDQAVEGRAAVAPGRAGASGVLRITASGPFGRKIVTPMLARFLTSHPGLRAELRLSDDFVDLAAAGVDVALRIGELRDNGLVARRLADNPRGLFASPTYVERHGRPVRLADLAQHECLTTIGATHWTFARGDRVIRQPVTGRFTTDSFEALHQASLEGMGIVMLSDWNVRADVAAGDLMAVELTDAVVPNQGIWGVMPSSRLVPIKVRLFLDAFAFELGKSRPD